MSEELFYTEEWASVLCRAYGFEVGRTAAGGMPYVAIDDSAGKRVSVLPFSDYLPLGDPGLVLAVSRELTTNYPEYTVSLKTTLAEKDVPDSFTISRRAVYHRFTTGELESSFARGVRRARRDGLRVVRSTKDAALDRFLELYHWQRLRKFGGIPQPPSFFRAIHDAYVATAKGFYLEAIDAQENTVASLVILRSGSGWFYKFGASDPAALNSRPNNLLFDHLTQAIRDGEAAFLDLGLSGAGEAYAGLRRFKSGMGAVEFPIHYLTVPGPAPRPGVKEFKQLLTGITGDIVAADFDRATTALFSERVYRFFA